MVLLWCVNEAKVLEWVKLKQSGNRMFEFNRRVCRLRDQQPTYTVAALISGVVFPRKLLDWMRKNVRRTRVLIQTQKIFLPRGILWLDLEEHDSDLHRLSNPDDRAGRHNTKAPCRCTITEKLGVLGSYQWRMDRMLVNRFAS